MSDDYESVKRNLLSWHKDQEETRKRAARNDFENATRKSGESLLLYSNRLLNVFRLAFPKKKDDNSEILVNKFRYTIPKDLKTIIDNQVYNFKLRDEKIPYKIVQKCARIYDAENNEKLPFKEAEEDVVVVNLTKPITSEHRTDNSHFKKYQTNTNFNRKQQANYKKY